MEYIPKVLQAVAGEDFTIYCISVMALSGCMMQSPCCSWGECSSLCAIRIISVTG